MSTISIFLIALGLSMDAFAVSITSGITIHKLKARHALLIAAFFGGFQAIMPLIGWSLGRLGSSLVTTYDHWIAFVLLLIVGGKMIWEAFHGEEEEEPKNPLNLMVLLVLAIATSIDALAIGVTLSFLKLSIIEPVLMIGAVTFVTSYAGTYIGDRFGHLFENKLEIIGGLILIGIGLKILIEHLFF